VALDRAREARRGDAKIGTTGRGIGPAYEDKVDRRAVRVRDLFSPEVLRAKVREVLDLHNFVLEKYHGAPPLDPEAVVDDALALAPRIAPMVADVPAELAQAGARGDALLFEGAQGALLDVDHGTYRSSPAATASPARPRPGPAWVRSVCSTCSASPRRTRHGSARVRSHRAVRRRRRASGQAGQRVRLGHRAARAAAGWFDAVAMRRSIQLNGVSGLCVTKLDVLDGLPEVRICTGYVRDGAPVELLPFGADDVAQCAPVYETLPGWTGTTFGVRSMDRLPAEARRYLERLSELAGAPVDMVSTGPDRDETILLRHPFQH
jgi:adenylosuccinate synthase